MRRTQTPDLTRFGQFRLRPRNKEERFLLILESITMLQALHMKRALPLSYTPRKKTLGISFQFGLISNSALSEISPNPTVGRPVGRPTQAPVDRAGRPCLTES